LADKNKDSVDLTELKGRRPSWWKLPFDPTTSFSLFGFFLGGFRCDYHRNKTDMKLEDE